MKDSSGKVVKKKQATLKTRKSLSGPFGKKRKGDDDDSGDDFVPTKTVAKAAAKREPIDRKVSKSKPLKKAGSDDDDDNPFANAGPSRPAGGKAAEATGRKVSRPKTIKKEESDDDDDDYVIPAATAKRTVKQEADIYDEVPRAPSKSKIAASRAGADSDDDDIEAGPAKNKGKAKVAPKRKRYVTRHVSSIC